MNSAIVRFAGVGLLIGLLFGVRPVGAETLTLTEESAIDLALQQNPELRVAQAEVDAARGRLLGASVLLQGNPKLEFAGGPRFGQEKDTVDLEVGLSQPVEIAGQRSARIEAASASVEAAKAHLAAKRLDTVAAVRRAFGAAQLAEQRRAVAREGLALAQRALETAEARLEAGNGTRIELNAARIEVGRSQRLVREAGVEVAAAIADLRTALGVDAGTAVVLEGEIEQFVSTGVLDKETALAEALRRRPELIAARKELEAARASERLAAREAFPTPRVGAAYSRDEGDDIVQATLAIDLPLFNRNQAARAESSALVTRTRTTLEAIERAVREQVELAVAKFEASSASVVELQGPVFDASDENLRLATEGYEAGKLGLLELLLVRQGALDSRHAYLDALEQLVHARAELERAVGGLKPSP